MADKTRDSVMEILQDWVLAYADLAVPLTSDQLLIANENIATRPGLPYLTLFQPIHDVQKHMDETLVSCPGGQASIEITGERSGVLQVHTYGDGSDSWLTNLAMSIHMPQMHFDVGGAGVTILQPLAGIIPLPKMKGANLERHFVQEYPYSYRISSGIISVTALENAGLTGGLYETDPATIIHALNITVDLTAP